MNSIRMNSIYSEYGSILHCNMSGWRFGVRIRLERSNSRRPKQIPKSNRTRCSVAPVIIIILLWKKVERKLIGRTIDRYSNVTVLFNVKITMI